MYERVTITAIGIISALGTGKEAQLTALRNSQSGIKKLKHLKTIHANDFVLGEADRSDDDLAAMAGNNAGNDGYTRTTLLAIAAFKDLLDAIDIALLQHESFAFINANTVGGMSSIEDMYMDLIDASNRNHLAYIDTLDCAESTQHISDHFGLKPFLATISTACSSSANAMILGARMIKHGIVPRAICGGCDALSRFTLNGFHSLKNVSKTLCKPFDQNRQGLNLGEGAGYLLLESEQAAKKRGANIVAYLDGYCNNSDAYHPTAPSPNGEGAKNAMQSAIKMAGITPADVNYINAHGTATINNDIAEGKAIETLFGNTAPAFSSTKPFTGHTLAAAGAIEAIFSICAMQEGFIIPNLNFETPMEELGIKPTANIIHNSKIKHVLSNSFGFGGNNVSLLFSKP